MTYSDSPNPNDCYILANGHLYPPPTTIIHKYLPGINSMPFKNMKILQLIKK